MTTLLQLPDLGTTVASRLKKLGITKPSDLLTRCANADGQSDVGRRANLNMSHLRGWLRRADLLRVSGVNLPLANALVGVGLTTVGAIARLEPRALIDRLKVGAPRQPPLSVADAKALVAASKALPPGPTLPEGTTALDEGSLADEVDAAQLLAFDGLYPALEELGHRLIRRATKSLIELPRRGPPATAAPIPLLNLTNEQLGGVINYLRDHGAERDLSAEFVGSLTPAKLRKAATTVGKPIAPHLARAPDAPVELAIGADALHLALRKQLALEPHAPVDAAGLAGSVRDEEGALTQELIGLQELIAHAAPAELDAELIAGLVAFPTRVSTLAALQARLQKYAEGHPADAAPLSARVEAVRRKRTVVAVFRAQVLRELRHGLPLEPRRAKATSLPFVHATLPWVTVAALREGTVADGEVRLIGRRVGVSTVGGKPVATLIDVARPDVSIEVALPEADPWQRRIYKPPLCALRVRAKGAAKGRVTAQAALPGKAAQDWLGYLVREVEDAYVLFPGNADAALFPTLLEIGDWYAASRQSKEGTR